MRALADVNWLLALSWAGHQHHVQAASWLNQYEIDVATIALCRVTQLSLLRLLTNPTVMGVSVCSTDGAWRIYDRILLDPRFTFVSETADIGPEFRRIAKGRQTSPKVWQDQYLAAFAIVHGLSIVTFDSGFKSYKKLNTVILGL